MSGEGAPAAGSPNDRVLGLARRLEGVRGWRRFGLAFLFGAISALAMPPFDAAPVLFATLPALVLLLDGAVADQSFGRRLRAAAAIGWWFGFGYFLAGLWWIGSAFLVEADVFAWMLPFAVAGLPAGLALFYALATALAAVFWTPGPGRTFALALGFAAAEWLRGHVLTGFPWNGFGYALTFTEPTMQAASLVGVYGLAFLAVVVFAAPAALIRGGGFAGRAGLGLVAVAAAALLAVFVYGGMRLDRAGADRLAEPEVHLRIVQPSIDQKKKWDPAARDQVFDTYLDLSRAPPAGGGPLPDGLVLVWPESAVPFFLADASAAVDAIAAGLPPSGRLLTGAARYERTGLGATDAEFYNSILQVTRNAAVEIVYDKVHLVPFGEFLPFQDLLERLGIEQLTKLPGGFTSGKDRSVVRLSGVPPFSALICYEIVFPGEATPPGDRPAWLLNLTNDAWFGRTPGPYQHLRQARVRAVEEGLPLVRAANTGISAMIDPYGRILDHLALGDAGVIDARLPAPIPPTVFARFGDLPLLLALLLTALSLGTVKMRNDRRH